MATMTPADFRLRVRIANHHEVSPGNAWNQRILPDFQFINVQAGRCVYRDQAGEVIIGPGQVLAIEPGVRHDFAALEAGRIAGIHAELAAHGTWSDGDYRLEIAPARVTTPEDRSRIEADFRDCAAVHEGYGRWRRSLCDSLATSIVLRLAEQWGAGDLVPVSVRMQAMVDHMRRHAVQGCTRYDLARVFHLTPGHVDDCFHRELGLTPTQVLTRERCRLAYRLLHAGRTTVSAAATAAGFSDPFYFSRVFRRHYGHSPSLVRGGTA